MGLLHQPAVKLQQHPRRSAFPRPGQLARLPQPHETPAHQEAIPASQKGQTQRVVGSNPHRLALLGSLAQRGKGALPPQGLQRAPGLVCQKG